MRTLPLLYIVLFSITWSGASQAQWVQATGPYGGVVRGFAVSTDKTGATTMFAASEGGVFLSTDYGNTWIRQNTQPPTWGIAVSAPDSSGKIGLYIGTKWGAFRSYDTGKVWDWGGFQLPIEHHVGFLVMSPADSAGNQALYAITMGLVYFTRNGGDRWTDLTHGKVPNVISLALIPGKAVAQNYNLFIGTSDQGAFISRNNGYSWTALDSGLTSKRVNCFTWTPPDSSGNMQLFAGTAGGIFRSDNYGVSWTAMNDGLANSDVQALIVLPAPSGSGGANILAGTWGGGVFRSTNSGEKWEPASKGLTNGAMLCFATSSAADGVSDVRVFAGTSFGGAFRSTDYGSNWVSINSGLCLDSIATLQTGTDSLNVIYAAAPSGGVQRSTDEGANWESVNEGLTENGTKYANVAVLSARGNNIFAGTEERGVFHSTNGGVQWTSCAPNLWAHALVLRDTAVFAGCSTGIHISTDNGATWEIRNTGLTRTVIWGLTECDGKLFAGTPMDGIFTSTDNGINWKPSNAGLTNNRICAFEVSPILNGSGFRNIFAGTIADGKTDGSVFLSTNNGASWYDIAKNMKIKMVTSIILRGAHLFVANTNFEPPHGRVFFTTNIGASWNDITAGLPDYDVNTLALSRSNIFAGMEYGGVWKRPLAELITDIDQQFAQKAEDFSLAQNFPNPFHPVTSISFSLPLRSFVSLKIYDCLGREMTTIISKELPAGNYSRQWNAGEAPAGPYFYRLEAGTYVETRKLVLVR